jgi:predicted transglutaminase-like cysteine proteinase
LLARELPRAAFTMAFVHHKKEMFAHSVLPVETNAGTFVLDNLTGDILLSNQAPYNYEARERGDGKWDRFDKSYRIYEMR